MPGFPNELVTDESTENKGTKQGITQPFHDQISQMTHISLPPSTTSIANIISEDQPSATELAVSNDIV